MKLLLSSCDFRNERARSVILSGLSKPIDRCRALFIPNEKWTAEKLSSGLYVRRMQEHGFSADNVFIFDPRTPESFLDLPLDAVYVSGGNSFKMLSMLRRCAFDREIIRYVRSGAVYIGGSAGAHLASQSLDHLACYDAPPEGMTDFRGLRLFPGILLCHYSSERRAHYERLLAESHFPVYPLTDEDSIVFED